MILIDSIHHITELCTTTGVWARTRQRDAPVAVSSFVPYPRGLREGEGQGETLLFIERRVKTQQRQETSAAQYLARPTDVLVPSEKIGVPPLVSNSTTTATSTGGRAYLGCTCTFSRCRRAASLRTTSLPTLWQSGRCNKRSPIVWALKFCRA